MIGFGIRIRVRIVVTELAVSGTNYTIKPIGIYSKQDINFTAGARLTKQLEQRLYRFCIFIRGTK